jgi:hypothetical protein
MVARWKRSGLSAREFAEKEGVSERPLTMVVKRVARDGAQADRDRAARSARRVTHQRRRDDGADSDRSRKGFAGAS